ncbi:MAG: manganese efflux pump [Lachnospiraceae bacterium]|nr:manganese efflux pump [Lachnospiraceae bacterium]
MSIYGFVINSIMLGVGLAMDAFSVSIANGLHAPDMKGGMKARIAGTFAGFQFLMPMLGWLLVHYLLETFEQFQKWIPWIALALLLCIGGKMIFEAFQDDEESDGDSERNTNKELIIQGIATSIDALSVGFTIADYKCHMAFLSSVIIAVVTYIICQTGLRIGIRVGMKLAKKASVLGGLILIFIGIEIFVRGVIL